MYYNLGFKLKRKLFWIILFASIFLALMATQKSYALVKAPGGEANDIQEVNVALGSCHEVKGNTITLKDDVLLCHRFFMNDIPQQVIIDADGHTISAIGEAKGEEGTCYNIFNIHNCKLKLTGNGIYRPDNLVIAGYSPCDIVIDNGDFDYVNNAKIRLYGWLLKSKERVSVTINGGDFGDGVAVNNGLYDPAEWEDDGTYIKSDPPVDITINGGVMDKVAIESGCYYDKLYDAHYSGAGRVKIPEDSKARINELICIGSEGLISGGEIGILKLKGGAKVTMKGGSINGHVSMGDINQRWKYDSFTFKMLGGEIRTDDDYAISITSDLKRVACIIAGGSITTTRKGAKGILLSDMARVELTGGSITSENGDGSAGIYIDGHTKNWNGKFKKKHRPEAHFKASKKSTFKINGYKYGCYVKKDRGKTLVMPHTMLKIPGARKKKYYSGQKIPMRIKGNILMKYSKRK